VGGLPRFWTSRGADISVEGGGYLVDPISDVPLIRNPNVAPIDFVSAAPCLVLLGEPGIGKSFTLSVEREEIEAAVVAAGDLILWIDLHEVGSDQQLNRRLGDSDVFRHWREGTGKLHLFLDSFDECRVQVNTLPAMLLAELRGSPVERMILRVACRTADWPPTLESGLRELWGVHVDVRELLPLRRVDVRQEAIANGVDGPEFLKVLDESGAVPFAIKPTTLAFLINAYKRDGSLPKSQVALYEVGCRMLCEESAQRRDALRPRMLNEDQILAAAGRIAALMVFGNRAAIWTDSDHGNIPVDDVPFSVLTGGMEQTESDAFKVDDATLKETLNTGLFSSRGLHRLGWAHQTYAEFLAARYLKNRGVPHEQVRSLVVHPDDPSGRLVPQLQQTTAWLASMEPEVFLMLMDQEPDVLLQSDITSATDHDRKALISRFLSLFDRGEQSDRDWSLRRRYAALSHPDLADQLRPYIVDQQKNEIVRRVVMHIAEACKERRVLDDLVHLALDETETQSTRVAAAYAIIHLDSDEHRCQLKPLVFLEANEDPIDELKGCGLLATWPQHLRMEELVAVLTPFQATVFGAYRSFLSSDPFEKTQVSDMPQAIRWAHAQVFLDDVPYEFDSLINSIMRKAWQYLENPLVLSAFTAAALARVREHGTIFGNRSGILRDQRDTTMDDALQNDTPKRRLVIHEALRRITERTDLIDLRRQGLIPYQDVPWLIGQYQASPTPLRRRWAELIEVSFNPLDRQHVETLLELRQVDSTIRAVFAEWFDPVNVNSEEAERARRYHAAQLEWAKPEKPKAPSLTPSIGERIAERLARFATGQLDEWWQLNFQLMYGGESNAHVNEYESDLTKLLGWSALDQVAHETLAGAAEQYIKEWRPAPDQWITQGNVIYQPDWAGFRAFRLLLFRAPERLALLPAKVWSRWAEVLVAFPTSSGKGGRENQQRLVAMAYQHDPEAVISTFFLLIDPKNQDAQGPASYAIDRLVGCWDKRLEIALLNEINTRSLAPDVFNTSLDALLEHGVAAAVSLAKRLVQDGQDDSHPGRAAAAASSLLLHVTAQGWNVVWDALSRDAEFGEMILQRIVHQPDKQDQIRRQLDEEQLATFYIWIVKCYPHKEDPSLDGHIDFRRAVAMWRDSLLTELKNRGTTVACEAIERIMVDLPHLNWVKWVLHDAQRLTRQLTWSPLSVEDIRRLIEAPERRLVQSGDELLSVIGESLVRLQAKLQTHEPPRAPYLWNEKPISPKDEERLSDWLKIHLDEDLRERGIIFNREVTNRRGDETDIRVETFQYDRNQKISDLITVIIEVKGNWHRELRTAMKDQLAERYMDSNASNHGLYVVGWYESAKWDEQDWRRTAVRQTKMNLAEAKATFDRQAAMLSTSRRTLRAFVLDLHLP